jgi:serine/threonine protein kinase
MKAVVSRRDPQDIDGRTPPFDQFKSIEPLAASRGGRLSNTSARHRLYVARDKRTRTNALIKLTSKPGVVYQQSLENEIASLSTINRELPDSRYFPVLAEHGHLDDGRTYLITSLFDEFPLATSISPEGMPHKMVTHLMTAIEVARALNELHRLGIFHVDLNPMNILYRSERERPVIRIVDFESSYERSRHAAGVFYNPSKTPEYSAPEVPAQPPDGRSDLYSLGAVLYTMLAGFQWTWEAEVDKCLGANQDVDPELKSLLLKAVNPDPDRRYPSVDEFRAALSTYLEQIWPGRSW